MEIRGNVGGLLDAVYPAVNTATKNCSPDNPWNGQLCIIAKFNELVIVANGGNAAVKISFDKDSGLEQLGYTCLKEGSILIKAEDFYESLKSYPRAKYVTITFGGMVAIENETAGSAHIPHSVVSMEIPVPYCRRFKKYTVNRKVFLDGLRAVLFAAGQFTTQYYYMCISVEISKNRIRFTAGSGARFVVMEFSGKGISKGKKSTPILFPVKNISNITTILSKATSDKITIKETQPSEHETIVPQIVIGYDNVNLVLMGMDTSASKSGSDEPFEYPPVDNIIGYDYPYKISSDLEDWKYVAKGIESTNTEEYNSQNDILCSVVTAHLDPGYFEVATSTSCRSSRSVPFNFETFITGGVPEESQSPWFCCKSLYLTEIVSKGSKHKKVTLEFGDRNQLDNNSDGRRRPVVVRYPEKVSKLGIKENFCMFFATSKKEAGTQKNGLNKIE